MFCVKCYCLSENVLGFASSVISGMIYDIVWFGLVFGTKSDWSEICQLIR